MYLELIDSYRLHLPDIRAFSIHLITIFTGRCTLQHKWFEESHFQYWLHRLLQNLFIFFSKKRVFCSSIQSSKTIFIFVDLSNKVLVKGECKYYLLPFSWCRSLSHRNQFINLESKSMDWFLYNRVLHHERVKNTLLK